MLRLWMDGGLDGIPDIASGGFSSTPVQHSNVKTLVAKGKQRLGITLAAGPVQQPCQGSMVLSAIKLG